MWNTETTPGFMLVAFLICCTPHFFYAQSLEEDMIDSVMSESESSGEDLEDMAQWLENIIEINAADDEIIRQIPFLPPIVKENIISYRKKWGNILSLQEMTLIEGCNVDVLERLSPILDFSIPTVKAKLTLKDFVTDADHEILLRASAKTGPDYSSGSSTAFAGDRHKTFLKYKYVMDDLLSACVVYDKDAGEQFIDPATKYPEHLSGFVKLNTKHLSVLAGDYYVQIGQGIGMWTGMAFPSGIESVSQMKYPAKIKPKTSSDEVSFLRGGAINFRYGRVEALAYFSWRNKDASLQYSSEGSSFSSLSTSGYHRTLNEIAKRNVLSEMNAGGGAGVNFNRLRIFFNVNYCKYNAKFVPSTIPANVLKYSSNERIVASVNTDIVLRNSLIYTEIALANNLGYAAVIGWYKLVGSRTEIDALYRIMSPTFAWVNAPSAFKYSSGEHAMSIKAVMYLSSKITCYARYELIRPLWFTFRLSFLLPYSTASFRIKYNPRKYVSAFMEYKYGNTTLSSSHKIKFQVEVKPHNSLTLRTRLEASAVGGEKGLLMYQDVAVRFSGRWSLICRITSFDIESYAARINCYENDVLYNFSAPAYYGRGFSSFFVATYKPIRILSLSLKTHYLYRIDNASDKLGVTVQLRFRWS